MLVNQLFCLPTPETMAYLMAVTADSSIDLDPNIWGVEIITTQDAVEPDPGRVYEAYASSVKVWYDAAIQRSSLLMSLVSPDLQRRCIDLNSEGVLREFYDEYFPYLPVRRNMPANSRRVKRFTLQLANAVCDKSKILTFGNEFVIQSTLYTPPDFDYNMAMSQERQGRRDS